MRAPAKEWDDGMGLTNGGQLTGLFLSCGLGFLLGLYYDGFRVARLVMRSSKRVIFFQDLFFFVSAAILTFFFALTVTGGELRFYLFLGPGIGFTAYYFTIGRVVMAFAETAVRRFWPFGTGFGAWFSRRSGFWAVCCAARWDSCKSFAARRSKKFAFF